MEHIDLYNLLKERFGEETVLEHVVTGDPAKGLRDPFILIRCEALPDICEFLKTDERTRFDLLHCISAVDRPEYFESVYHLFSMLLRHWAILKVRTAKTDPHVPSVARIWPAADWHEREAYDLMGIVYDGHPNLKRILLPDEWEGHPLRKDYTFPEHEHLREIGL
ncbi:MAG: NADH-quinone oxidoreductase subunit C [Candidatus Omnitrophota bacterium]|jgi:NADH-quinone oxidoreductase subunit C|nr:MAG: NADH-quinone oxidoreductase subunit C [Candidatus Omnitrophota bacterium]